MRFKKILASFMTAGMMLTFIPTSAMAATVGWNGNDSDGWRYYTTSSSYVKNDWKKIDGKWYYFNSNGYMESNCYRDGYWLTKSGAWDGTSSHGTWEKNSNGWWYEDSGWYPVNRWLWIDGECYYFDSKGFMEYNCYRDGCWLSSSGAWDRSYSHGTWKKDSKGWWYEDNGWYPKSQWLWIDGEKYWFGASGYWNSTDYYVKELAGWWHRVGGLPYSAKYYYRFTDNARETYYEDDDGNLTLSSTSPVEYETTSDGRIKVIFANHSDNNISYYMQDEDNRDVLWLYSEYNGELHYSGTDSLWR